MLVGDNTGGWVVVLRPIGLEFGFQLDFLLIYIYIYIYIHIYTGLFISPSGISELDCATTKTDTAERSISIDRESLQVFFFFWY